MHNSSFLQWIFIYPFHPSVFLRGMNFFMLGEYCVTVHNSHYQIRDLVLLIYFQLHLSKTFS